MNESNPMILGCGSILNVLITFISLQSARTRAAVVGSFFRWTNLTATFSM